eukprot:10858620-Alexandrium_andersonii.AAC.1
MQGSAATVLVVRFSWPSNSQGLRATNPTAHVGAARLVVQQARCLPSAMRAPLPAREEEVLAPSNMPSDSNAACVGGRCNWSRNRTCRCGDPACCIAA